ncbi:MAG TPA: hypothetical protein VM264_05490 [Acidimicrobiales bacterium]|nr:hypothetical protein [Acidimicrobiales bacterium]
MTGTGGLLEIELDRGSVVDRDRYPFWLPALQRLRDRLTRSFIDAPERFVRHLLAER